MSTSHVQDLEVHAVHVGTLLDAENFKVVCQLVEGWHAGDVAQLIQYLTPARRALFVQHVWSCVDGGEILTHLDDSVRESLTELLEPVALAEAVKNLESDDAFSVLDDLSEEQKEAVLAQVDPLKRQRFEVLQTYPRESAARLMQQEMVMMSPDWTVKDAIKFIASNKKLPGAFYYIYLVTADWRLVGRVALADVIRAQPSTTLHEIIAEDVYVIPAHEDREQVALDFKRYSLISAPVVDQEKRLLGVITADDILTVLDDEAEEDIMHLGGISASDFYAPVFSTTFSRFQWLLVTFVNTILASWVISQFQMVLEKKVALAILMPIVAAMGGNAGMQVVTVVVRALATNELNLSNMGRTLWKSLIVSLLNGILFALLLSTITVFWFSDLSLGVVLGCAMLMNMLWAGVSGTLLPIFVERMGVDPALSAGPILTTTTDVLGYAIFLGLARSFLF